MVHRRATHDMLAGHRTAGTAVALTGAAMMLGGLVLAWPQPDLLIVVGIVDAVALTALALTGRLPALHMPAVAATAFTLLLSMHLHHGTLSTNAGTAELIDAFLMGRSGLLLLGLAAAAAFAARRWNARRSPGRWPSVRVERDRAWRAQPVRRVDRRLPHGCGCGCDDADLCDRGRLCACLVSIWPATAGRVARGSVAVSGVRAPDCVQRTRRRFPGTIRAASVESVVDGRIAVRDDNDGSRNLVDLEISRRRAIACADRSTQTPVCPRAWRFRRSACR